MSDVVVCSTAMGAPLTSENAAGRIAQLNMMDAIFMAVAQKRVTAKRKPISCRPWLLFSPSDANRPHTNPRLVIVWHGLLVVGVRTAFIYLQHV